MGGGGWEAQWAKFSVRRERGDAVVEEWRLMVSGVGGCGAQGLLTNSSANLPTS